MSYARKLRKYTVCAGNRHGVAYRNIIGAYNILYKRYSSNGRERLIQIIRYRVYTGRERRKVTPSLYSRIQ